MNSVNFKSMDGISFRLFESSQGGLFLRPLSSNFCSSTVFCVDSPRISRNFGDSLDDSSEDSFLLVFSSCQIHIPESEYDSVKEFLESFGYVEAA